MITRILPAAFLAALLCAAPAPARSQTPTPSHDFVTLPRGYVDWYAASPGGSYAGGDLGRGFGARLTLRLAAARPLDRLAVGAYAAHLPARDGHGQVWEYGAHTDVRVLGAAPRAVDPLLTLGLGAVHRDDAWRYAFVRRAIRMRVVEPRTGFALSPGVGARLRLAGGVALRGDVRHAFALDRVAQGGTQVAGGISLPL